MRFSAVSIGLLSLLTAVTATPIPAEGDVNAEIPDYANVYVDAESTSSDGFYTAEILNFKGTNSISLGGGQVKNTRALEKRVGPIVLVLGITGSAALVRVAKIAIEIATDTLKSIPDFNKARSAFTTKTTNEMWRRNPDYKKYAAVACYNKGYRVQNWNNINGKASVKVSLDLLHTNYDCMYIAGPNQFYTNAEGGSINLSYTYDPKRCTFDKKSGDLSCR